MQKIFVILALVALIAACTAPSAVTNQPAAPTLAPNITPLVTQIGAGSVQPSNHLEAIRQAGVIRVGTSADYPPFEFLDSNGVRLGFDIELMEEIAGRLGVRVEWVDTPFNDLIDALQAGKIDIAISAFEMTEERDALVDFSRVYYTPQDVFLAGPGFTGRIAAPADIAAYTVGVPLGSAQETWLRETLVQAGSMSEASVRTYEQIGDAAADLLSGEIQLIMIDFMPAHSLVQANPDLTIAYRGGVSGGPLHVALPQGDVELTQAIDAVIQQLENEGFIQRLAARYLSTSQ